MHHQSCEYFKTYSNWALQYRLCHLCLLNAFRGFDQFVAECISCIKLRCDERFTHAFTVCGCVFKEITLVGSNQGNYFENATVCSKGTLKTIVATWLYYLNASLWISHVTGHPVGEGEYDAVDVVLEDVGLDTSNRSIHAKTINDSTNIIGARAKQLVRKSFFTFKRNSS